MKKRFRNKDLEEILAGVAQLGSYPMPGDLTLSVIGTRKVLKEAYENYTEARKQIGETRCERDEKGWPLSVFQKDEQGNDLVHLPKKLKFRDEATEVSAVNELKRLGEQEVDVEIREFDREIIEGLTNITPIQMEAITTLVEITNKVPLKMTTN